MSARARSHGAGACGARLVTLLSGKGGVGKTALAANLGVAMAGRGARVLLLDGDLGLANVDVLLGLVPERSAADVIEGRCELAEAVTAGPGGLHVLPAASGRPDLVARTPSALAPLLVPLLEARRDYDVVLADCGAGIGAAVLGLAAAADEVLLVTSDEPTALADAYATLKVLGPEPPIRLVVNGARNARSAHATHERLVRLGERFLGFAPELAAWLPADPKLVDSVARQRALVELHPHSPAAVRIGELARELLAHRAPPVHRRSSGSAESTGMAGRAP